MKKHKNYETFKELWKWKEEENLKISAVFRNWKFSSGPMELVDEQIYPSVYVVTCILVYLATMIAIGAAVIALLVPEGVIFAILGLLIFAVCLFLLPYVTFFVVYIYWGIFSRIFTFIFSLFIKNEETAKKIAFFVGGLVGIFVGIFIFLIQS